MISFISQYKYNIVYLTYNTGNTRHMNRYFYELSHQTLKQNIYVHLSWSMLTPLLDLKVKGILCAGIDGMSLVHVQCHIFQISK